MYSKESIYTDKVSKTILPESGKKKIGSAYYSWGKKPQV